MVRQFRRPSWWVWGCVAALFLPRVAQAQVFNAWVDIEAAPGSEACPDVDEVFRSLQRLFPERQLHRAETSTNVAASARVLVRPTSQGHEAIVTVTLPRVGERVIQENDSRCLGLSDALAVALVMLLDPPPNDTDSPPPSNALVPTTEPVSSASPPTEPSLVPSIAPSKPNPVLQNPASIPSFAPSRTNHKSWSLAGEASGLGGFGVLNQPSIGLGVGIELIHAKKWVISLQGLRLWAQPLESEYGKLTLSLWGVWAGPCYRNALSTNRSIDWCARFGVGSELAKATDYENARSPTATWLVASPSLRYVQSFTSHFSGIVEVGLLAHLQPHSFSLATGDAASPRMPISEASKFGYFLQLGLLADPNFKF